MEPSSMRSNAEGSHQSERVREFVRQCLEVGEHEGEAGVERLFATRPDLADAARRRLILLRVLGFYRFGSDEPDSAS